MTAQERCARYAAAYLAANGNPCEVSYVKGWYRIRGHGSSFFSKHRAVEVDSCIADLERRVAK
jgi:hypothetical protein